MGCCHSRPAASPANNDGAADPPNNAHVDVSNSSSRHLNAPSLRHASAPSSRGSYVGRPQPAAHTGSNPQPASNGRPNQPLTPIPAEQRSTLPNTLASPTTAKSRQRVKPLTGSSSQAWTRARLETERRDWWDTRVTGNIQVWQCLRAATEALQQGDVATAQGLLDAQGCNCPTGQLWGPGVYDDSGIQYKIPEWLIIEPAGLVEEEDIPATENDTNGALAVGDDQALGPDREFVVRARISSPQQDFLIPVRRRETIASIREKLKTQAQLNDDQKLRLVYNGRVYADHEILETNGFWNYENNYVLSCFVPPKERIAT